MINHINALFKLVNRDFLGTFMMTAVGNPPMPAGRHNFNLTRHLVGPQRQQVARLTDWALADELPILGYWAPQGNSCLIPAQPLPFDYVFTPDFSGCSIIVDQIDANHYRVYHVTGGRGRLAQEYTNSPHGHGLGIAAAMTFDDYGTATAPCGFAFLRYEHNRWWIYYQRQSGVQYGIQTVGSTPTLVPSGTKSILGGGLIPVADLATERPRRNLFHGGAGGDPLVFQADQAHQVSAVPAIERW